ncbi:unnamed protein product [Moneuplotes crassus]|uniref:Uncharacterized protein n=1 Tax=Euplotes crassus TaxID=5936 RepID=A0AAD1UCC7_EUPCR|nr:unnamed protein product [Moneuplotes crassus]
MKFPKCQHRECCEVSVCYLLENELYLCQHHRLTQYPEDDSVLLVDDSTVEMNLKTIETCRKDFLAFTQMLNKGSIPPGEAALITNVEQELIHVFDELRKVQDAHKYYEFGHLSQMAMDIKDVLEKDPLYAKFLIARAWNQSLAIVKGESLKSSELVEMELKLKYNATFDKISKKSRQLRREFKQRYQQEIEDLKSKLTLERSTVERLNKELEDQSERHTEELKAPEQEKENLKINYDNIRLGLISNLNLSERSDLSLLYKIITGEDKQIRSKTILPLNLDNPKHMEFLRFLNKRMSSIHTLNLRYIPLNCREVKTFLSTHFPNKVSVLNFNCLSSLSSCVPFYLEELVEVSKRVTGWLFIYKFEVSQDQLVSLFSANRHKIWFGFTDCKLSLSSVPDFEGTLAGSTMKGLSLTSCGRSSYGDWGNNECHFENLIAGLSKEEDFRKNLKRIRMDWCGMEENDVEKILVDHGFGHVKITFYSK